MLTLYIFLYICSFLTFLAAAAGLYPKVNLLGLGLALFTLVPLLQALNKNF